jgi:hypothetical protein
MYSELSQQHTEAVANHNEAIMQRELQQRQQHDLYLTLQHKHTQLQQHYDSVQEEFKAFKTRATSVLKQQQQHQQHNEQIQRLESTVLDLCFWFYVDIRRVIIIGSSSFIRFIAKSNRLWSTRQRSRNKRRRSCR